jgi:hypothetical protein
MEDCLPPEHLVRFTVSIIALLDLSRISAHSSRKLDKAMYEYQCFHKFLSDRLIVYGETMLAINPMIIQNRVRPVGK